MKTRIAVIGVLVMVWTAYAQTTHAEIWDAYTQYSATSNTSTDVWQYLWTTEGTNTTYTPLVWWTGTSSWRRQAAAATYPSIGATSALGLYCHPGVVDGVSLSSVFAWQSPISGNVDVSFSITDALVQPENGDNGVSYCLFKQGDTTAWTGSSGTINVGGSSGTIKLEDIAVSIGTKLYLQIGPRSGSMDADSTGVSFTVTSIPEPGTLSLLGIGLVGLFAYAWRKRR